jgi:hypothetical protein
MHPFVVGEKACESLRDRSSILELLQDLPAAVVTEGDEVPGFIECHVLRSRGIGHVDVRLLASVALTEGASLWRRDNRLRAVASELGCAHQDAPAH